MSKPPAAVPTRASSACRHSKFPCASFHSTGSWTRCGPCSTEARDGSNSSIEPSISICEPAGQILEFFLERYEPGLFLHFEMIPDRFPESLRGVIQRFPDGALQFEVGVQTFNDDVAVLISRRQDNAKLEENLRFLRDETGVHVHADLIVGLPGESAASFAAGFDRLVALGPQEIQVGMLKRLRGTPIVRHDAAWQMVYHASAPYEVVSTRLIDANEMTALRRFAKFWDLVSNSGNFTESAPLVWEGRSPFAGFFEFANGVTLASSGAGVFR